jgi:hypothetical protein
MMSEKMLDARTNTKKTKLQWVLVPLKITTKHFEATLQKIERRTIAINNPSLV